MLHLFLSIVCVIIKIQQAFMLSFDTQEIEYLLEHLGHPETLNEQSFQEWLLDDGHRQLFERVRDCREAYLRVEKGGMIDPAREWERFEANVRKRSRRGMRHMFAFAASILVFFIIGMLWQTADTETVKTVRETELVGRKSAELILAAGQRIDLGKQIVELCEANGVRISNSARSYLAYRPDTLVHAVDSRQESVWHTVKIPAGADYKIYLSDGTGVWLNCGSELRYPVKFTEEERRVYLRGEAFFEVEKVEGQPFVVETERMRIQVTGTRFNVNSYPDEEMVHATLVEGAVSVTKPDDGTRVFRLLPSQQFSLDKLTGQIEVKEVDTRLYTDWTEGMFVFRKQRLEEVMNTLARWYGIEVFYSSADMKDLRLSAHLGRYEHIDTILDMIRAMDKVVVNRKGNVIIFSWK